MKIFINGKDGGGWAIDMIRKDISAAIKRLNLIKTKNLFSADIIHNIWWNQFLIWKYFPLRFKKKIILTAVNFINLEKEDYFLKEQFHKINKYATAWITPSSKQKKVLEKFHNHVFLMPYYLDFSLFDVSKHEDEKVEILKKYSIPEEIVKGRIIISSFQRDSVGRDLSKPKWQKGPELLIKLLKDLPKDKFILLLASSRRHYVINECKKYNIPYFYVGQETDADDVNINNLPLKDMPRLYSITDLYLVTSTSEGGPKAILEATAMKTFIYSTDVGLASDFLDSKNIFTNNGKYKEAVTQFVKDFDLQQEKHKQTIDEQYKRNTALLNPDVLDKQLLNIYNAILSI